MDQVEIDPDARLVIAAARGHEDAFAALYRQYLPVLLHWLLRETRDRELAADLAAEVFAAALISVRHYRPERGPVIAWLFGIARNKLRESRRRNRVEASARLRLGFEPVALTDSDLERVEELASVGGTLETLLCRLPEEQRDALRGRVVEEHSYRELSAQMRCSELVVRQRVSRALKSLRSQMEEPR
ncbi:MAG TPA: RNA polymerase sigma factor [Solirubrobacteraceae bacterium]|jgi:RNA polymerase sigma-70 factor (ECF subfamily)|nr:RNA polymerase sigma factor [Solirubrobacteraceae bacterium]